MPSYTCPNGHAWSANSSAGTSPKCPLCGQHAVPNTTVTVAVPSPATTRIESPNAIGDTTNDATKVPAVPAETLRAEPDLAGETLAAGAPAFLDPDVTEVVDEANGGDDTVRAEGRARNSAPRDDATPGPPPPSIDQFLANATAAGLLDDAGTGDWTALIPSGESFADGLALGRELVSKGKMTEFQLRALCEGSGDPLVLGEYVLLEPIGAGGMGAVYRARDRRLGRDVALKLLSPQLARDAASLERFEREGRATAMLDHDHIVTVYDVGSESGRHYIAMQLVEGRSLADLVRDGPLVPQRAARILAEVANGVQSAHDAGILHRDLKPHNVLVESATGRALVVDFGIAKLVEQEDELTRTGDVMGTPAYMAPEQARDSGAVTSSTDVYALGATLYFLLTGRAPFSAATVLLLLKLVTEAEPVRPSRLNPSVDPDLETICLKCLEKETRARYASAAEFEAELRRFLRGEPILARPISRPARLWRWCRRNRRIASLAAVAILAVVSTLVATTIGYVTTSAARVRAERGYREARSAVHGFFTEVAEDDLLDQPGLQPLRERLLRRALEHYSRFLEERGDDPNLRDEIADVHDRVGRVLEEIDGPEAALEHYRQALATHESRVAATSVESPEGWEARTKLGTTWNAIGSAESKSGNWEVAAAACRTALDVRRDLHERRPDDPDVGRSLANTMMNLALSRSRSGAADVAETRNSLERANAIRVELLERHPGHDKLRRDLAAGYFNLGNLEKAAENNEGARTAYRAAEREFRRVVAERPRDLRTRLELVTATREAAAFAEDDSAMRDAHATAIVEAARLARENPEVHDFRIEHARLLHNHGLLLTRLQEFDEAGSVFDEAIEAFNVVLVELGDDPPVEIRRDLAAALRASAIVAYFTMQTELARTRLERALTMFEALAEESPDDPSTSTVLAEIRSLLEALPTHRPEAIDP